MKKSNKNRIKKKVIKAKESLEQKSDGSIFARDITHEMERSYLEYAMSVIVSRALPDVRDGLKPVQRRILYAMHEMGLRPGAKFQKSAKVVGYVLGNYHPHGDSAAYEAMVRMAQDFSLRYPLVKGQGNFGNIDGDSAAAYRYTEARLAPISEALLTDIDRDTVRFRSNFDSTRKEPEVLPTKIPNLLVNGTVGIAVGMATSIPPHNLAEAISAAIHLIDNPSTDVKELMQYITGPDFPTGGTIYNEKDILNAYATGRGPLIARGKAEIEETKRGFHIVITEIPYQVNKSDLVVNIADLVRNKRVDGIRDVRDESSDRDGIRIIVELKQDSFPKKVLNALFKYTELQKTFHFNMLALVDGVQPQTLGIKALLEQFVEHRRIVTIRRTKYDLRKAKERAHILEGLKKALDHIDEIIRIIKKSESRDDAAKNLIKRFKFSDRQTSAILEMKLQALAGLERKKINDELKEKRKIIAYLENLLASPKKILSVVKSELSEIKEKYGDERRTRIIKSPLREIGEEELVPEEDALFLLTRGGYIKRLSPDELRSQKRGGKGLIGIATKEEDVVGQLFLANTHDSILFFTNSGKVFQTKGYEVPEASRQSKGRSISNFLQISQSDSITAVVPVSKKSKAKFLFMATAHGVVKKVAIDSFEQVRRSGIVSITLKNNDELRWVIPTSGDDQIVLTTSSGSAIRFSEKNVRPMGRSASGVLGIRLETDANVVGVGVIPSGVQKGMHILVVTELGFGKRTDIKFYKVQNRGGRGILTVRLTTKTGSLVSAHVTTEYHDEFVAISKKGQIIRSATKGVSVLGRATQGVRIMRLDKGDSLAAVVMV